MPNFDAAQREAIAQRILELSTADQTEALVSASQAALMRFTHELSNQHVDASDAVVSVRAIAGRRTGVAQTNRLDDAALLDVAERAMAMARLAPEDPMQGALPAGGTAAAPANAYDATTAAAGADARAQLCDALFRQAESGECWSAGYAATSCGGITVANTSGARASFDGTDASLNVKMSAVDSSGFAESYATGIDGIDAVAVGRRAVEKARDGSRPQAVDPGPWTVILEAAAFGELLVYLAGHFSAQSFDEGSSFCSDGLDRPYFAPSVTIRDDYAHPLAPSMPFDYEGQPTNRLMLVERGIVRNVVTDSYYARKLDRPNTGHALPAPNAYGPQARNLIVDPGDTSTQELIAQTPRGLLVSRLWYVRTVDQKRAIVTGMTRDGTFLIENGAIVGGVRNMRFNVSIVDLLQRCEFSREQTRTGGHGYSLVVPQAKISDFTFTSATDF